MRWRGPTHAASRDSTIKCPAAPLSRPQENRVRSQCKVEPHIFRLHVRKRLSPEIGCERQVLRRAAINRACCKNRSGLSVLTRPPGARQGQGTEGPQVFAVRLWGMGLCIQTVGYGPMQSDSGARILHRPMWTDFQQFWPTPNGPCPIAPG